MDCNGPAPAVADTKWRHIIVAKGFREVSGRLSFFGWTWRILFGGWNLLMAAWAIIGVAGTSSDSKGESEAETIGAAIGVGIGLTFILVVWAAGSVILGLFVLFTRPAKAIVPIESRQEPSLP